eukprot:m.13861 g.13861  ORF g.13861 m.13861 type:complete len:544 (+) comp4940_c0_seq1:59-1690(+)
MGSDHKLNEAFLPPEGSYQEEEQDTRVLYPYSETPTSYNFGPRETTDRFAGYFFIAAIVAFLGWSMVGVDIAVSKSHQYYPVWRQYEYNITTESCVANTEPLIQDDHHWQVVDLIVGPILIAIVMAFLFGGVLLAGFRHVPAFMVWTVIIFKVLAPAAVGVAIYVLGTKDGSNDHASVSADDDGGYDDDSNSYSIPAYFLFGLSFLLALIFFCFRTEIRLTVKLFKESALSLQQNWILIPVQIFISFVAMIGAVILICLLLTSFLYGNLSSDCSWQVLPGTIPFAIYGVIIIGWYLFWALETRTYLVGDSVGFWYWHGKSGGNVTRAMKHVFLHHFGSMALAGLVVWFVEALKSLARRKSGNILICLLQCLIQCILSYIQYLCKMSVIVCGITGQSFIKSGHQVVRLFTASFGDMSLSAGLWFLPPLILRFFVFLMSALWAVATGFTVYARIKALNLSTCDHSCAVGYTTTIAIVVFLIVLFILGFFAMILNAVLDTIFMCFMIDKSKGIVTKPELHAIIGQVLDKKNVQPTPNQTKPISTTA